MALKYISPAVAIVFIAVLVTAFDDLLVKAFMDLLQIMYPESTVTLAQLSNYLGAIIFGLLGISLFFFIIGLVVTSLFYNFYTFTLEEFDLRLRRGVLHREEISIPYRQMQNVNIVRTLFYQILGVSKLYIDSAGHEDPGVEDESEIILQPIEKEVAEEIRSLLEHRIGVQIVESSGALGHEHLEAKPTAV